MNQNRSHDGSGKTRRKLNKAYLVLLSLVLLVSIAAGATVAYLTATDDPIENTFDYAQIQCSANNTGKVTVTTNTPVYIRVAIVTSVRNSDGEQLPTSVDDAAVTLNTGWVKNGDYYYYTAPVSSGDYSIGTITPPTGAVVEVLAEAIQANAAASAWGVDLANLG